VACQSRGRGFKSRRVRHQIKGFGDGSRGLSPKLSLKRVQPRARLPEGALRYDYVAAVHALRLVPVSFIANDPEIFRDDLYHRLCEMAFEVSPPRARREDISVPDEEIRVDTGCDLAIEGETRERSPDVGGAIAAAAHLVTT
jgi:hypothetical protein